MSMIDRAFSMENLGGQCIINLCGSGETLLPPEMPSIIRSLLNAGHIVMVVTNGTLRDRFDEILGFPGDLLARLFFKFSFHYAELKERHLLESFTNIVRGVKKTGCSFTVELTPDDSYLPFRDEILKESAERFGAPCHVTVVRDERSKDLPLMTKLNYGQFVEAWQGFKSDLFAFKWSIFARRRKEFCYAGDWSLNVDLASGNYYQCNKGLRLGNIYKDDTVRFRPIGNNCELPYCFNGHAYLCFGVIPELITPDYVSMRNRICSDGTEWLSETIGDAFRSRLYDNNEIRGLLRRLVANVENTMLRSRIYARMKKLWRKHENRNT